ncbi:biotin--[acetyl-CoA-carboxylase] ligase [Salinisphaera orenii]|uniref:biotin--[acetyl-CoA-carboxylase] ligase n=1 Tax=Salinisphaera orenii TaxID=856731 RepID=UPI000DBE25FF
MNDAPTLLELLADREWHSGNELAHQLGVSRAAVSARAKKLTERGLSIHSVVGRGYRLAQTSELLDAGAIRDNLPATASPRIDDVRVFETVDSTNDVLDRLDDGAGRIAVAEAQTAGRGRTGRGWVSPFGCNLHMSLMARSHQPQAPVTALAPLIGVRIAAMLSDMQVNGVGLKWPNDLLINGTKVGGILVDYRGEAASDARLIIGVGINVAMAPAAAAAIDQSWTTLSQHLSEPPSRNTLAARVTGAVDDAIECFRLGQVEHLVDDWQVFDRLADTPVVSFGSNAPANGIARGINTDGSLRIEANGRVSRVYSGDVSIRPVL